LNIIKISNEKSVFIDNLCDTCYIELHPLLKFSKPLILKICKKCNRFYLKDRWISSHSNELESILDNALKDIVPLQIDSSPRTEIEIQADVFGNIDSILKANSIDINIQAKGRSHGSLNIHNEVYKARKVSLVLTICPSCLSLKRGEFKAVLHIITPKRELLEQERDYIISVVERETGKSIKVDHLSYISKFTMKRGKITFYVGSEKFARSLASIINYNLGGILKESYKFGSHRIPKEVKKNKLYISLYLPSFVTGDLLRVNEAPFYVTKIQGKNVSGINLKTKEKFKRPLKTLKNASILLHASDLRSFIYFSQTKDTIQLIDLESNQIYEVPKSFEKSEFEIGKYLKGFEVDSRIYLIPNQ